MKCCPACGQLVPETPSADSIKLTPLQRRIVDIVRKCPDGISAEALFERIYGNRADGGPGSGVKVLHVHIDHLNRRLRTLRLTVKSTCRGPDSVYKLIRGPNKKGEQLLTDVQRAHIRQVYKTKKNGRRVTQMALAKAYNVSQYLISTVVTGTLYK